MNFVDLNKNDVTFGIIAPASPFTSKTTTELKEKLNELGFQVIFGESCTGAYKGYLSSTDEVRAKDIMDMFCNPSVDAILCIRGGYGVNRLLHLLDFDCIKNHAKPFIGYSDITALHLAFNKKCGFVSYHGIMAGTVHDWDECTFSSLMKALTFEEELVISNPSDEPITTLVPGYAEGELIGGNLALITSLMGTEFEIDVKDKIIFIEDVGESVYRVDRMLTQLALAGKFDDCKGIVFGDFSDCTRRNEAEFELLDLIEDRIKKYNKPCIYNVQSGHCTPMITILMGAKAILDATNKKLVFKK